MSVALQTINASALVPMGDRVLVQADIPPEKSAGGIILPETSKLREPGTIGKIVAVGASCKTFNQDSIGTLVLFGRYSGHELPDRKDLIVMAEKDVLLGIKEN